MRIKPILTALVITVVILYAQSPKTTGTNPAIFDTNTPVVAKLVVSDLNSFASQWKVAPTVRLVKIAI
ncbi:hypothetical protein Pogu_2511 [Pyrobaculum oguniense TE7]|uniref:Uncharacterized protein n=1 Tax=Pyrobaculum oguniense (strain DSM 13380 / JCM 10595 / TE7) TaxID=698757 RepID=H6QDR6_PYROT|nr:hypothetical protein Pogu_2511 [Pyrobaculum oguniense TE7]